MGNSSDINVESLVLKRLSAAEGLCWIVSSVLPDVEAWLEGQGDREFYLRRHSTRKNTAN
jgi:hypothetical protein